MKLTLTPLHSVILGGVEGPLHSSTRRDASGNYPKPFGSFVIMTIRIPVGALGVGVLRLHYRSLRARQLRSG